MRAIVYLSVALLPIIHNANAADYFTLQPDAIISGDTWHQNNKTYRLYGIQACLRNTFYTDKNGQQQDCGIASADGLAAFIADTTPSCSVIIASADINYTMCYATVGSTAVDLGTALIASGYAFASLNNQGLPYVPAYSVAEKSAAEKRKGLWAFTDVQHPAIFLSQHAKAQKQ